MTAQTGMSFITTFTRLKPVKNGNGREQRLDRCVGFLSSKEQAIEAVEANAGDIHEAGTYPLCVVETLGEGIYPSTISTDWFEWNAKQGGYQKISGPPDDLKGLVCFSLG